MADTAFVWIWLPEAVEPVVAGRLFDDGGRLSLVYGRSYLAAPTPFRRSCPHFP